MTARPKTIELTFTRTISAPPAEVFGNLPDDEYGRLHNDGWTQCLGLFVEQFPAGRPR